MRRTAARATLAAAMLGPLRTFISAMVDRAETDDAGIAWLKKLHENTDEYLGNPGMLYDHIKTYLGGHGLIT